MEQGSRVSVREMAGEAWPMRLRRATTRKALKQGRGQGLAEKASSIPRASRTSAALALERESSRSSSSGRWVKSWPLALRG
jgi:hypothetical protein